MDFDNLPWPDKDDDLLELGDDWTNNACLNYSSDELSIYSEGYKRAGNMLSDKLQKNRNGIDFLIYPLIFLYRHHIELELKIIIKEGNYLLEDEKVMRNHHKLHNLWDDAKKIIEEIWSDSPKDDLKTVEKTVLQLNDLDPGSYAFRYDRDKQGNKPNPDLNNIDIKKFSKVINNISAFFAGVSTAISVYNDHKNEMKRHYSP